MKTHTIQQKISWLFGILLVLLLTVIVKGCDREHRDRHPGSPEQAQQKKIHLTIPNAPDPQAKATSYYITAVGVAIGEDQVETEIGPVIGPIVIENPEFPLSIPVTLYVPPCLYRITIGVTLVREPVREKSAVFDVCENSTIDLTILTFEEFQIYENPIQIHAPDPVIANTTIEVSCGATQISAPDSDRWPLSATLWEEGGARP